METMQQFYTDFCLKCTFEEVTTQKERILSCHLLLLLQNGRKFSWTGQPLKSPAGFLSLCFLYLVSVFYWNFCTSTARDEKVKAAAYFCGLTEMKRRYSCQGRVGRCCSINKLIFCVIWSSCLNSSTSYTWIGLALTCLLRKAVQGFMQGRLWAAPGPAHRHWDVRDLHSDTLSAKG